LLQNAELILSWYYCFSINDKREIAPANAIIDPGLGNFGGSRAASPAGGAKFGDSKVKISYIAEKTIGGPVWIYITT